MKALCTVALQGLHSCCGSPSSEVMVDTTGRGDQRSTDGSYTRVAAPSPPVTTRYCSVSLVHVGWTLDIDSTTLYNFLCIMNGLFIIRMSLYCS